MLIRDILTLDDLNKKIMKDSSHIFLYFYAPWCGTCQAYGFKIEQFSLKYPNTMIIKIDISISQALSNHFKILNVPSVIVLKDGLIFHRFSHIQPIRELEKILLHV